MEEKSFILPTYRFLKDSGEVTWKAPSNIALVKYWGKKGVQIPANPSLSFTLDHSATITTLHFSPLAHESSEFSYEFFFEGKEKKDFRPKIDDFLSRIEPYLPFLKHFHFRIETSNSFPHSSGIASSASAFAALSLCFVDMERMMTGSMEEALFNKKASFLARLGSGSACRSIQGPVMHWGNHAEVEGSNDLYAVALPFKIHPVFSSYRDTIMLVDRGQKSVSSTAGHQLMHGHRFAANRFEQAHANISILKEVLGEGNLDKYVEIVESEALSLHAMMMTSIPYYLLMKPNTIAIIQKVWEFRLDTGSHLCFTLDAGANVHLLYPEYEEPQVIPFIESELIEFCEMDGLIKDQVGGGGQKLS